MMAEIERVRERERPPIQDNPYERILRQRRELAERNLTGPVVRSGEECEWFMSRQGRLKFFLDPVTFKDTPLQHWRVFGANHLGRCGNSLRRRNQQCVVSRSTQERVVHRSSDSREVLIGHART